MEWSIFQDSEETIPSTEVNITLYEEPSLFLLEWNKQNCSFKTPPKNKNIIFQLPQTTMHNANIFQFAEYQFEFSTIIKNHLFFYYFPAS